MEKLDALLDPVYTSDEAFIEAKRCLGCKEAPCLNACPSKTGPHDFIASIKNKRYEEGIKIILDNNPFGASCGHTCPSEKYCEKVCLRGKIDKPIHIRKLQEFLMEYKRVNMIENPVNCGENKENIAIIGGGPSGLTIAKYLRMEGYQVTIFEKEDKLGGALRYGIPSFRLPINVLDKEIDEIISLEVNVRYSSELGRNLNLNDVIERFDAVAITIGKTLSNGFSFLDGNPYVVSAIDLLRETKLHPNDIKHYDQVVVLGGSDVAMDAAISLKMLGTNDVVVAYRREEERLRASKEILEHAKKYVDEFKFCMVPTSISNNIMSFKNYYKEEEFSSLTADLFVVAIGQNIDEHLLTYFDIEDGEISKSRIDKLFFSGDLAHGDKTVVEAVKLGKDTAKEIINHLRSKR